MRIFLFNRVIRTASSLRKIIEHAIDRDKNSGVDHALLEELIIAYNCRVFGICVYPKRDHWKRKAWFIERIKSRQDVERN